MHKQNCLVFPWDFFYQYSQDEALSFSEIKYDLKNIALLTIQLPVFFSHPLDTIFLFNVFFLPESINKEVEIVDIAEFALLIPVI